jgi:phytoene synthase
MVMHSSRHAEGGLGRSLVHSYRFCEALTRQEAGNFYPAFRVLPGSQRLPLCALYAFMRVADDLSDEPGPMAAKRANLALWRQGLEGVWRGEFTHPCHEALAHTVDKHAIPRAYLEAVLDGVQMDLEWVGYTTFADLRLYCYRVASAVGLACIHVWGFSRARAKIHAEQAGLAFQLTNILRDLGEDAARGRVYLPREDLLRFGYSEEKLHGGERDEAFRALMRFQVQRARSLYAAAWRLVPLLSPPGRAVFLAMAKTYRSLLDAIEASDYDVFKSRIRVSKWRKLMFLLQALPARWELV